MASLSKLAFAPSSSPGVFRGVYQVGLSGVSGTFIAGNTLSLSLSGATGTGHVFISGTGILTFSTDNAIIPVVGDLVTQAGGFSGTVVNIPTKPDFLSEGVAIGSLISVAGGTVTATSVTQDSITASAVSPVENVVIVIIISTDFTPNKGLPLGNETRLDALAARVNAIATILDGLP